MNKQRNKPMKKLLPLLLALAMLFNFNVGLNADTSINETEEMTVQALDSNSYQLMPGASIMDATGLSTNKKVEGKYAWIGSDGDLNVAFSLVNPAASKEPIKATYNGMVSVTDFTAPFNGKLKIGDSFEASLPTGAEAWLVVSFGKVSLSDPFNIGIDFRANGFDIVGMSVCLIDYTVTYDPNGGIGAMTDIDNPYKVGDTITILANEFIKDGYNFAGWNTKADASGTAYQSGDTFLMSNEDVVLYAQWSLDEDISMQVNKVGVYQDINEDGMTNVGDQINYTITVKNTGNVTLTDVVIIDTMLGLNETVAEILVGDTWTHTQAYNITQADIEAGSVLNTVLVNNEETEIETDLGQETELVLEKTADKTTYSTVGEVITYTYKITNSGNITLAGPFVVSDDNLDADQVVEVTGELAPGASGTTTAIRTVTQADLDVGRIENVATAAFGDTVSNRAVVTIDSEQNTEIEVVKVGVYQDTNEDGMTNVGDQINYTITVKNTGNVTLTDVVIIDTMLELNETVAEILVGDTWTHTQAYDITQTDIEAGTVLNTVLVNNEETEIETELGQTPSTISVTGEKVWVGGPSTKPTIELQLFRNGEPEGEPIELVNGELTYTWTELDKTDENAVEYIYTIDEVQTPSRYVKSISEDGLTITNRYKSSGGGSSGGGGTPTDPEEEIIEDEEIPLGPPDMLNMEDHFRYIAGYPNNTVQPEGNITREEVAAVFFRLLKPEYRDTIRTRSHNFSDVEAGRWSEKPVATLAKGKIIRGYEDGSFRPGNNITRAELAVIASRFDNLTPFTSNKFSDINNHWAKKQINSAAEKGWVNGYGDGTFKPDQYIIRAEFIALVNNVLNRHVKVEDILDDAVQFPDLSKDKWYYATMQESLNSHHYTRAEGEKYETWTEIYHPVVEM